MSRLLHPFSTKSGYFPLQANRFAGAGAAPQGRSAQPSLTFVQDRFLPAKGPKFGNSAAAEAKPNFFRRNWDKLVQWSRLPRISFTLGLRYGVEAIRMFGGLCLWSLVFIPFPQFMAGTAERIQQFARNRFLTGPKSVPNVNLLKDPELKNTIMNNNNHMIDMNGILEKYAGKLGGKFKPDQKMDGVKIHAWHIPVADKTRPTVIVHHGRGSNIMHLESVIQAFRKKNMGVIVYDYPGFGKSGGSPSPEALCQSGVAMSLFAQEVKNIPLDQQIIFGNSLGSIVAANTAKALEEIGAGTPKALVLVNPLPSLKEVFIHMRDRFKLGWLYNEGRLKLDLEAHQPLRGLTHTPVQVIRGEQDKYIPMEQVRTMFERIGKPDASGSRAAFYEKGEHLEMKPLSQLHHRLKDKDYPLLADEVERFIQR